MCSCSDVAVDPGPMQALALLPMYNVASYLVVEPKAGSVPEISEVTRLAAPSATNSLFGETEYPKRTEFSLAAAIESRKPTTVISLMKVKHRLLGQQTTYIAVEVVCLRRRIFCIRRGFSIKGEPLEMETAPKTSTPDSSHRYFADKAFSNISTSIGIFLNRTCGYNDCNQHLRNTLDPFPPPECLRNPKAYENS